MTIKTIFRALNSCILGRALASAVTAMLRINDNQSVGHLFVLLSALLLGGCASIPEFNGGSNSTYNVLASVPDASDDAGRTLDLSPVDQAIVSSDFGMRQHPIYDDMRLHGGVDFAAAEGAPIYASGAGEIVALGPCGSFGNYIQIRHSATYDTAYAHLNGFSSGLSVGDQVNQGDIIGYVGTTGGATGPHLHFEVLVEGEQVDPRTLDSVDASSVAQADGPTFSEKTSDWYQAAKQKAAELGASGWQFAKSKF